jgi:hypothetical protein
MKNLLLLPLTLPPPPLQPPLFWGSSILDYKGSGSEKQWLQN